jgi:hypothetical protein
LPLGKFNAILTTYFTLSSSYSTIFCLNLKLLRKNYNLWGPSARTCIALMNAENIRGHKRALTSAAYQFPNDFDKFGELHAGLVSHQLVTVRPTIESREVVTAEFASEHVLSFVSRAYARHDHAMRQRFYNMISGHAWYGAAVGHIFKRCILLWLRHPPARDRLPCVPAGGSSPALEIPACWYSMQFFSKEGDLKDVGEHDLPKCLVPVSQSFPTVDAIVVTGTSIITVQITVTSAHDTKDSGFQKVYDNLPSTVLNLRRRCHVFVTDTEDKAEFLRQQQLTLPTNMTIDVYSTFVNVDQLNLITTDRRMEELEDDIVSSY